MLEECAFVTVRIPDSMTLPHPRAAGPSPHNPGWQALPSPAPGLYYYIILYYITLYHIGVRGGCGSIFKGGMGILYQIML